MQSPFVSAGLMTTAMLLGHTAMAADDTRKFEIGFSYGKSDQIFDASAQNGSGTERSSSGDLWLGYPFTPTFGAQFGYWMISSGHVSGEITATGSNGRQTRYTDLLRDVDGWSLSGTATWPINDWVRLTGRAGLLFWHTETRATEFLFQSRTLRSASGESPTFGLGLAAGDSWGFRVDYDRFFDVDDATVKTITGGLFWRF